MSKIGGGVHVNKRSCELEIYSMSLNQTLVGESYRGEKRSTLAALQLRLDDVTQLPL